MEYYIEYYALDVNECCPEMNLNILKLVLYYCDLESLYRIQSLFPQLGSIIEQIKANQNILLDLSNNNDVKKMSPYQLVETYFMSKPSIRSICILDLSENELSLQYFEDLTHTLRKNRIIFPELRYLVLSNNYLNGNITNALEYWLKLPNIKYINLISNPFPTRSMDSLYLLLSKDHDNKREIFNLIEKVICWSLTYTKLVVNTSIYKRLINERHIPVDSIEKHIKFYNSSLFTNYQTYKSKIKWHRIIMQNLGCEVSNESIGLYNYHQLF